MNINKVFYHSSTNMNEVPDNSVDLIITSPPYFNIKDYTKNGTQDLQHSAQHVEDLGALEKYEDYLLGLLKVWLECYRALKPNGKLCINVPLMPMLKKVLNTHYNRHIFDLHADIQHSILHDLNNTLENKPKMFLLDVYIWKRANPTKRLMFGSYPYPRNFYAQNTIEFIGVFVKDGKPKQPTEEQKEQSQLTQEEWVEFTKQIWEIPIPNKNDIAFGKHAALMPAELARRLIRLYSCVGDVVLDPFSGSGTTFLDKLEDKSVDLAIIDPPYNLKIASWDSFKNDEEFLTFSYAWIDKVLPKIKDTRSFYIFNTPFNCALFLAYLHHKKAHFLNFITWVKKDGFANAKKRYNHAQESILFYSMHKKNYTFNADEVRTAYESTERIKHAQSKGILKNNKRWFPNPKGKLCLDVWEITSQRHVEKENGKILKPKHPSIKPKALIERMIKASSNENDLILDLFSGSGMISLVAKSLGRNFIGCETHAEYVHESLEMFKYNEYKSQHNRYDQNKIKIIIQAIFNEAREDFLQIRTTDMSKRPSNIIGEEVYAKVVDNICKSEMPQDNLRKKNQVTQDSLRKNLFVDMHRMGLIERYNKNKEPTNPYIQSNIKYISLTPLAIEFLNAQDLLRKNFCYTQALENLLQGFGAECREVMIELENHYLDIEEMMFFVTFLNIENFTRSEIIEYVREYRSLSRIQKEKLKELVQNYCNPNHFNGNKLDKRDYHNWKNQAQQIFSLLEQSVFFETNKERLILKTLNEENKQNDKKLKRSIKEKALYFEKHGVKKEKGFELHHIVPLCLARSVEEFDLLDKWENLIYIDAFNHAKISQTQNKHICLYFENCDVILSKGLKEEQESLYFTYIENVLYKLDLQNVMLEYNKDLLHSKNG